MVFYQKERANWKHKSYVQSQHDFLDESAWPLCAIIRDFINGWSCKLPADAAFVSRVQSKNDKQHLAALFELLVFGFLKGAGFNITPNAVVPGVKTTDFTLREGQEEILLECTLTSNALESVDENRKKGAVLQTIEDLEAFPFYVNVAFKKLSPHSISKRDFLKFLQAVKIENGHLAPAQKSGEYCYCGQGWGLVIMLVRKPESANERAVGVTMHPPKMVDNNRILMTTLNDKKGSKYKIGGIPYIICVSVDDMTASEEEFAHVLFGPNYLERLLINQNSDGFFLHKGQPQNTSVSAVLFCERFTVFGLMGCVLSLWHNPYAVQKLKTGLFPFKEVFYREEGNTLHRTVNEKQTDVFEFLNLDGSGYKEALRFENRKLPPVAP